MKKLTIEEYKEKLVETNKKVYELLADDSEENTVYVLHERGRYEHESNFFYGIFRNFKSLQEKIAEERESLKGLERMGVCVENYYWFRINKYLLKDGEYKDVLCCDLDINGILLGYPFDKELPINIPSLINVEKLFENGDIIKANSLPYGEPYYGIYLYDDNDENRHIIMTYDKGYDCYWITKPEQLEKVETCPIKKINQLNKIIKTCNGDYKKAFKKKKITMDFVPF